MWNGEEDEILIDFVRNNEALYNVKSKEYRKTQMKQNLWSDVGNILQKSGNDCSKRWIYIRDYYIRRKGNPCTGSAGEAIKKRSDLLSFLDSIPSAKRHSTTNVVGRELNECETPEDTLPHVEQNLNSMSDSTTTDSEVHASQVHATEEHATQAHATQAHATQVHATQEHATQGYGRNKRDLNSTFECTKENEKEKKTSRVEERLNLLKEIAKRNDNRSDKELDETDLFFSSMAKIVKKLPLHEQIKLRMEISSLVGNAELRNITYLSSGSSDSSRPGSAQSTL
ncbi:uncharacterized protein LOC134762592 [Penaeus indicus]|uniref:uncharacterized protein LOC134762592 n=1 Tax=Penaeus indicus TaxID=29960 RepID=UPI00300C7961